MIKIFKNRKIKSSGILLFLVSLLTTYFSLLTVVYGVLDEKQVLKVTETLRPSIVYIEISAQIPNQQGNANQKTFAKNGLILDEKGYILTSFISDKIVSNIKVVIDKKEYNARLIGNDKVTRISVIKIEPEGKLVPVKFSNEPVKLSQWLVGTYRLGEDNQYKDVFFHCLVGGIVPVGIYDELYLNAVPTLDGVILADLSGKVTAMMLPFYELSLPLLESQQMKITNEANMMDATPKCITIQGISGSVRKIMSEKESRKISWVGVQLKELSKQEAEGFGIPYNGVIVTRVFKKSPAEKAGIKTNDVIIEVGGRAIPEDTFGMALLIDLFRLQDTKSEVAMKIRRKQQEIKLNIKPVELPQPKQVRNSDLGLTIQEITDMVYNGLNLATDEGVVVVESEYASPADNADIKRADVIVQVQNNEIKNVSDYQDVMDKLSQEKNKNILVKLYRGNKNLIRVIKTTP